MDVAMLLEVVERENDVLRERVTQLEALLMDCVRPPLEWGLTTLEAQCFGVLVNRTVATKDAIMAALYSNRPSAGDVPDIKIVDVFVCKMRKKLRPFGVEIQTVWGQGYSLDQQVRSTYARAIVDKALNAALNAPIPPAPETEGEAA